MFCLKCGAQIADGTRFCSKCGTPVSQSAPQPAPQPMPQTPPQYATQPAPQYAPPAPGQAAPPVRRPSARARKRKQMIMITMCVCLLLIVCSVVATLSKPFYKIPGVTAVLFVAGVYDDMVNEVEYSMNYEIEYLEDYLDYYEDYMDDDEYEAAKQYLEGMEKLQKKFSILNLKSLINKMEKINKDYDLGVSTSEFKEMNTIMNIVIGVAIVFFILPVIFVLLGGLKRSFGLTIAAVVLTALSQMLLSGILWMLLSLAAGIYLAMLCKRRKRPAAVPTPAV